MFCCQGGNARRPPRRRRSPLRPRHPLGAGHSGLRRLCLLAWGPSSPLWSWVWGSSRSCPSKANRRAITTGAELAPSSQQKSAFMPHMRVVLSVPAVSETHTTKDRLHGCGCAAVGLETPVAGQPRDCTDLRRSCSVVCDEGAQFAQSRACVGGVSLAPPAMACLRARVCAAF